MPSAHFSYEVAARFGSFINTGTSDVEAGFPVSLKVSNTELRARVSEIALPSQCASAAIAHSCFVGIAAARIPRNTFGPVLVAGAFAKTRVIRATRANLGDNWAAHPAGNPGDRLVINVTHNGLQRSGAGASADFQCVAILLEGYPAVDAGPPNAYGDVLALTSELLVLIRFFQ